MWIIILFLIVLAVLLLTFALLTPIPTPIDRDKNKFIQNCELKARLSCQSLKVLPIDWLIPIPETVTDKPVSCYNVTFPKTENISCAAYGYAIPPESG